MSYNNPKIPVGDIAFFDNYLPSIEDGIYTISAKTEVTGNGIDTGTYFTDPITQDFEVRGPQFSMPVTEVHSVYPPNNSNSTYDQYLPNIVLNKRVIPWERYFDTSDKTIPWLCLLVFKEGEIAVDSTTNSSLKSSTAQEFLAASDDVLKPDISTDSVPPDVLTSQCSHIQISADVFQALVPKVTELRYLSHVRQVDTGDQAIMDFEDSGWFSVVTGNRLLKTNVQGGTRFFIHLVSLEGYYDIMNGTTAWPKKASDATQDKDIALASLYNWTFLSQPEKLDFKELVENFATQANGNPDNLLLRRYVTASASSEPTMIAVMSRFNDGYLPLPYVTPTGETTFAWYRGPFTPVIAQPLPRPNEDYHYPSPASLMIYDKSNGVFDQSYSASWSIGRALALSSGTFSQALLQFRRKSYGIIGQLMDALKNAGEATADDLKQIIQSSAVLDAFKTLITQETGAALSATLVTPLITTTAQSSAAYAENSAATASNPVDVTKSFLAESAVQDLLKEETQQELIPMVKWLAQIQLLNNIPFNHLVPDQLELPAESLRFFYIDQNWLDSLVDGALSVGVQSSKDSFYNSVMRGVINDAVNAETMAIRDKVTGKATADTEPDSNKEAMSGILIRSAVVSGWPGLVVKAFKDGDYETGTQLKMLRMERLSSNVLLCIFLDIPDTVMLAEPQQGLCFGVEDGEIIQLRQLLSPPGKPTGNYFPASGSFDVFFRPITNSLGDDVLNINDGKSSVVQTMQQSQYLNTTIGPAQFALQMVKAPEEISFKAKG